MKFKLALKNVRRQLGNYGIYFITVTMTVALMFAMNNVLYNDQIRVFAGIMKDLRQGLDFLLWFIAMVTAFVLGYGTSFMLRLRKREFGTYMILGMKRKDVMGIFLAETLFLAAAALISGIFLGLVVYQAMMAVVCRLMEVPLMFSGYSLDALKMTVILVLVIFALASAASAFYLRKVTIYQLLYGTEKKPCKTGAHGWFWMCLAVLCLGAGFFCIVFFNREMESWATTINRNASWIMLLMGVFGAAVLGWHISLAKCLMHGLMKSKKLCSRGTNTFVLRQLWDRLGSNALMAGLLAVLLTFAVAGANISFTQ